MKEALKRRRTVVEKLSEYNPEDDFTQLPTQIENPKQISNQKAPKNKKKITFNFHKRYLPIICKEKK